MKFSEEHTNPEQVSSRRSNLSSFSKKKMNWEVSERSSRFAILKHWATLTTLLLGIITMVGITTLFYRENRGSSNKGKFQSPIVTASSNWIKPEASTQERTFLSSNQDFGGYQSSCLIGYPDETISPVDVVVKKETVASSEFTSTETEQNSSEELVAMEGIAWHQLPEPVLSHGGFERKQPTDYFSEKSKFSLRGRVQLGFEAGAGKNYFMIADARSSDSQVVSDVKTGPSLCTTFGGALDVRVMQHWSVSTGVYQSSYTSSIIPRFFADTTGCGFHWPPNGEGEGEEHEEHGEHGSGENVVQFANNGYDVVTNTGVTHVTHDMDQDFNILTGSKEYFTYVAVPLNVNYHFTLRKFDLQLGTGTTFHHLKEAYALFNVIDDQHYMIQKSTIVGLKNSYFSQNFNVGVQYKLTYRFSVGAALKMNYSLTTMNSSTPFNTKINGFAGTAGVYYTF